MVVDKRFWGKELGAAGALCTLLKGIWVLVNGHIGEGVERWK